MRNDRSFAVAKYFFELDAEMLRVFDLVVCK